MKIIADHCIFDPVIQSLQVLRFPIVSIKTLQQEKPDYSVMQTCLENDGILITLDKGIPSQAYAFQYAQGGLTVVLLRWRLQGYKTWQQMVEVILRDYGRWVTIAQEYPSVISAKYSGSRHHTWNEIPPLIAEHAFMKEEIPPELLYKEEQV